MDLLVNLIPAASVPIFALLLAIALRRAERSGHNETRPARPLDTTWIDSVRALRTAKVYRS